MKTMTQLDARTLRFALHDALGNLYHRLHTDMRLTDENLADSLRGLAEQAELYLCFCRYARNKNETARVAS
jgi:hypothetical protein